MKTILLLVGLMVTTGLAAQVQNPAHWEFSAKKLKGDTIEIHLVASLDQGWHIYSQTQPEEAVAMPTKVTFNKNPLVMINGIPKEVGHKEKYQDASAGIIQYQYADQLDLMEKVVLKAKVRTSVTGTVSYQVCTNQMCLPPKDISFNIKLD